jgi:hypothetical protein
MVGGRGPCTLHLQLFARGQHHRSTSSLALAHLFLHEGADEGAERELGEVHIGCVLGIGIHEGEEDCQANGGKGKTGQSKLGM